MLHTKKTQNSSWLYIETHAAVSTWSAVLKLLVSEGVSGAFRVTRTLFMMLWSKCHILLLLMRNMSFRTFAHDQIRNLLHAVNINIYINTNMIITIYTYLYRKRYRCIIYVYIYIYVSLWPETLNPEPEPETLNPKLGIHARPSRLGHMRHISSQHVEPQPNGAFLC